MLTLLLALPLTPMCAMAYEVVDEPVPTALVDDEGPTELGYRDLDGHRIVKSIATRRAHVQDATPAALLAWVDTLPGKANARLGVALRQSPRHASAPDTAPTARAAAGHWVRQAYTAKTTDGIRVLFAYHWMAPNDPQDAHWRERSLVVDDGGLYHFEVTWDPKRKRFSRLELHGES